MDRALDERKGRTYKSERVHQKIFLVQLMKTSTIKQFGKYRTAMNGNNNRNNFFY